MKSVAEVERKLRQALPGAIIRLRPLYRDFGNVRLDKKPRPINVDPHFGGPADTLIHELIHVAYEKEIKEWGCFGESFVELMEMAVMAFIYKSRRRIRWWRDRIEESQDE